MSIIIMKTIPYGWLLLAALCLNCTSDITKSPTEMTDFVPGKVYALRKPVYISDGTLMHLRDTEPMDSQGTLEPGTQIVVRTITKHWSPDMGTYIDVDAEVLTGARKGIMVDVSFMCTQGPFGYTKRDPEMLELVENIPR